MKKKKKSLNPQRNRLVCACSDCKFKMKLYFSWVDNVWTNKIIDSNHNHGPNRLLRSDPLHRKFSFKEIQTVGRLWQLGTSNWVIKNTLEADAKKKNIVVYHTTKDIANLMQCLCTKQLDGLTSIQYLALLFEKQGI